MHPVILSAILFAAPELDIKESVIITALLFFISDKASIAFSEKHTSVLILNLFIVITSVSEHIIHEDIQPPHLQYQTSAATPEMVWHP